MKATGVYVLGRIGDLWASYTDIIEGMLLAQNLGTWADQHIDVSESQRREMNKYLTSLTRHAIYESLAMKSDIHLRAPYAQSAMHTFQRDKRLRCYDMCLSSVNIHAMLGIGHCEVANRSQYQELRC